MSESQLNSYAIIRTIHSDVAEKLIEYFQRAWNLTFWTQPGTDNHIDVMVQCQESVFQILKQKGEAFRAGWISCQETLEG